MKNLREKHVERMLLDMEAPKEWKEAALEVEKNLPKDTACFMRLRRQCGRYRWQNGVAARMAMLNFQPPTRQTMWKWWRMILSETIIIALLKNLPFPDGKKKT